MHQSLHAKSADADVVSVVIVEGPLGPASAVAPPDNAGALLAFEGIVRPLEGGRPIAALDYEAYGPLAEKEGARLLDEARGKISVLHILAVHRVGSLALGDLAVWVGVAAEHRGDAFGACRYVIDETKARGLRAETRRG